MNKKFTPTPHDAVFKQFLSEKETAKDFFDVWLPDEIKALCDLESLKVESGSFIDSEMKNYQSDILYSVSISKGSGYIYILIEHQSTPDKLIAWRLMRYSLAAMQKHLEAGHKQLPLVFPMLFYCGEQSPHPYSTDWLDCFEDRKLAERIYTNPFKLADVTTLDDGEIMQHKRIALLELLQKHIRRRDMTELLDSIVKLLSYNYYTDNQVITMFNYLIQEGNAQKPMEFITEIAKQSEKHEGALMTIAQQIEEIGIKKGMQQGMQQGKAEGRQEGKIEGIQEGMQKGEKQASMKIARQLLDKGVERDIVKLSTGLTDAEMSTLFKD
ncbi:Rpn family recombination-promoting nuclease/putative transposase (plasmid) [Arsenophonus nasoniae]|uniref:Rpn family recombination-promoting nuclease/putative transposase n=1 Tax=Arsenophonus nasoniae TaxID=638 RepID=A0A4P7L1T1_9GAMM|nr:Rpn family recombination-promoting nuclease/putative transposase [Arsenophonus nasoniae]QBY46625.1 Putative transposase, YhgA-like [Arsenophonus nasoniae]WGM08339.1 Rpn family recombination-promoting nuclease/putative transposase [Arsenophonus nasoniae]WGM13204.1 Rpn family recombination-promoting nuclease/putative transposase [Arsenophonus nasoniae]WGM17876.1 Rpn family recombination-promoting nuclease/putative transposase [Arsenophonus nasoniae]